MERGRDLEQVLNQYMNFVKPAFEEFCLPVSYIYFLYIYFTTLKRYYFILDSFRTLGLYFWKKYPNFDEG